jgi:hypothetical protein
MSQTDFSAFLLTISPEEQEFVAAHNLASQWNQFKWETYVPAGLVPQAIACYIQQKFISYMDDRLYAPNDDGPEVHRPAMRKKSVRRVRNEDI